MEIYLEKEDRIIRKDFDGSGKLLLKMLKITAESVIIVRNDEVITEDVQLSNNDRIKILSVISGG